MGVSMKKVLAVFLTLVVSFVLIGCHIDKPKTNEKFVGNFTSMGNALITFEVEKQDEQLEKAERLKNQQLQEEEIAARQVPENSQRAYRQMEKAKNANQTEELENQISNLCKTTRERLIKMD